MIKDVQIKYCEANGKYDLFVDGDHRGKHYTLLSAIHSALKYAIWEVDEKEK